MDIEYDKLADAIYIKVTGALYAYGKDLDNERRIDYDSDGHVRGIELLCVSDGVITDGLPNRKAVEQLLEQWHIKIFA